MPRCAVCDSTDNIHLGGLTPWRKNRTFKQHPIHDHLDICSDCDGHTNQSDNDCLEGEVANLIPNESYITED